MKTRWSIWVMCASAACSPAADNGESGAPSSEAGSASATMSETADDTASVDDTTVLPATAGTTGDTLATEGGSSEASDMESSTGEPPIQYCGLEDLKPGAPSPVVSGVEPMMIPPDIATILVDNCGCHYADMLAVGPPVADYSSLLPLHIDTWEQWQGTYGPTNLSTLAVSLERVRDSPEQLTMPHRSCYVGDGERMVPADRATLIAWMESGAPDGATWVP
ncbi:MAG: hypothetical protein IAG13_01540 [Deltaproteobacteria bacterium]|nr:hypothetical protein [Nannocystaceae bacterium]